MSRDTSSVPAHESALADSIARKGAHSYYFAHGANIGIDQRIIATHAPPPLLARSEATPDTAAPAAPLEPIHSYAWGDGTRVVRVYVDMEGVGDLPEGAVTVESTAQSVVLTILKDGKRHTLRIAPLSAAITAAAVKLKPAQAVLTLTKEVKTPWLELVSRVGAAGSGSGSGSGVDFE